MIAAWLAAPSNLSILAEDPHRVASRSLLTTYPRGIDRLWLAYEYRRRKRNGKKKILGKFLNAGPMGH